LRKLFRESDRQVWAWALYDWANSAFATAVIAGFFPVFFKQYWSAGAVATESTFRLGVANSLASVVVLVLAPILGAIADQGRLKKRFLLVFAALGIAATSALYLLGEGQWAGAVALYVLAGIGFAGANIFYDALLVDVAPERRFEMVSGLGYAMGYLGGGLLFAGCVLMTLQPEWFGLPDASYAVRLSFLATAVWWAVFSLPLARFVHEAGAARPASLRVAARRGFSQLVTTFHKIRGYRVVVLFLIAYWLYIDAVDTVVRMSVDYGLALGFTAEDLVTALLLVQFVGFPAALAFGWLGQRIGAKPGILIGLAAYVVITVWAYFIDQTWEFYAMAVAIGLVQGGVQALSRSLYAHLIPPEAAGEFFGFYNLLGKFAAVIGPLLMGWAAIMFDSTRVSILTLLVLFVAGAVLLSMVKIPPHKPPPPT
jgi:UMF1 family MFS transporter